MNQHLIYLPCFALLTLHTIILFVMFIRRVKAIKEKKVSFKHFKTYSTNEEVPELALQASRNFTNLMEAPVLFYVVCIFALVNQQVDYFILSSAWIYVATRFIHSYIHVTSNNIVWRMRAFALSWLVFYAMATKILFSLISF